MSSCPIVGLNILEVTYRKLLQRSSQRELSKV